MAKKKKAKRVNGVTARGVPCPRNAGTMTEAEYWGKVRNTLRKAFAYWKPAQAAFKAAECGTRLNPKTGKQRKIYMCAHCGDTGLPEEMQIDHIEPCGSLKSADDMVRFLEQLTCEDTSKYQVLHKECHQAITNARRKSSNGF